MPLRILGLGTATPPFAIDQADAAYLAGFRCPPSAEAKRLLPILYRKSGVRRRHSVVLDNAEAPRDDRERRQRFFPPWKDEHDRGPTTATRMECFATAAGDLAVAAAAPALANSAVAAHSISHLVTVTCSGFAAPGFDFALVERLGLPPTVARTQVGFMGCHGAVNGLRVAQAFAESQPRSRVLVVAVELCSLHFQYGFDPEQMVANSLFADGAAAVVGAAAPADHDHWTLAETTSLVFPHSADAMSWRIGDHGFRMTLSPQVPELIERHLLVWLAGWLDALGMRPSDVASWAVHPGGPRILAAVHHALGLAADDLAASRDVLAEFGNMSSPTLLFIVDRLRAASAPRPCVALGFGPGLVVEAALFR